MFTQFNKSTTNLPTPDSNFLDPLTQFKKSTKKRHTPYLENLGRISQFNKSTRKRHPIHKTFKFVRNVFFFSIQQVNSKLIPPLLPRFRDLRENMPYQQVSREKRPAESC